MFTIEPVEIPQLPSRIAYEAPNGTIIRYSLRWKGGSHCAYPYFLEYYTQSPATDAETIAFQSYGNTEAEAIEEMIKKLKAVGLQWEKPKTKFRLGGSQKKGFSKENAEKP